MLYLYSMLNIIFFSILFIDILRGYIRGNITSYLIGASCNVGTLVLSGWLLLIGIFFLVVVNHVYDNNIKKDIPLDDNLLSKDKKTYNGWHSGNSFDY